MDVPGILHSIAELLHPSVHLEKLGRASIKPSSQQFGRPPRPRRVDTGDQGEIGEILDPGKTSAQFVHVTVHFLRISEPVQCNRPVFPYKSAPEGPFHVLRLAEVLRTGKDEYHFLEGGQMRNGHDWRQWNCGEARFSVHFAFESV